ncbi:MAG: hypothetical protein H6585_01110 [Flavobacteriales bacterium]|nr:hypothetical protein [Flavobacteriales bacterium]MCB9446926.1 hypothetical protein [Flavobacteriales bacterium]
MTTQSFTQDILRVEEKLHSTAHMDPYKESNTYFSESLVEELLKKIEDERKMNKLFWKKLTTHSSIGTDAQLAL